VAIIESMATGFRPTLIERQRNRRRKLDLPAGVNRRSGPRNSRTGISTSALRRQEAGSPARKAIDNRVISWGRFGSHRFHTTSIRIKYGNSGAHGKSMSPDRWRQIEEIFHAAQEREAGERERFLAVACGSDEELRREVESLLAQEDTSLLTLGGAGHLEPGT